MTEPPRNALIFGARNLGRAIIETLVAQGWNVAGAARSDETLANVTAAGALALRSDITDQATVRATVEEAVQALGPLTSSSTRLRRMAARGRACSAAARSPTPLRTRSTAGRWPPRALGVRVPLGAGGALTALDRSATLIQVTGGSSRRAMAGRGLWAAGAFGVRARSRRPRRSNCATAPSTWRC